MADGEEGLVSTSFDKARSHKPELRAGRDDTPDKVKELMSQPEIVSRLDEAASEGRRNMRVAKKRGDGVVDPGTGNANLHLFPTEGTADLIDDNAYNLIDRQSQIESEMTEGVEEKLNATYIYFVQCEFNHQGLYFYKRPRSLQNIARTEWHSALKPKPDSEMPIVIACQVCSRLHNRICALDVVRNNDNTITVNPEKVYRVPRDGARARKEGISRGYPSKWECNNLAIEQHEKRVKELGYE